jgi:hypothetical protein
MGNPLIGASDQDMGFASHPDFAAISSDNEILLWFSFEV